jgi:ferredoxin--NADP+ reductase
MSLSAATCGCSPPERPWASISRSCGPPSPGSLKELHPRQLTFLPSLSREHRTGFLHGRITSLLDTGALEDQAGLQIRPEDSHLMLCGNSEMIKDVRSLLEARGLRRHRRQQPGHYTTEQYH